MTRAVLIAGVAGLAGVALLLGGRAVRGKVTIIDVPDGDGGGEAWAAPVQWLGVIRAAEEQHGIPPRLLERQLYQESRYRADIISGQVKSSAGAVGIAQIVPKWHPDVNPLDPIASIWYAASLMQGWRTQFGDWRKALAAYNWGPGNLNRIALNIPLWPSQLPTETRKYVEQITQDVPV